MSHHAQFHEWLQEQPGGQQLVQIYALYKQTEAPPGDMIFAYRVNGFLKGGHSPGEALAAQIVQLRRIICARNTAEMTVYRMTSDSEFVGPLAPLVFGTEFRYPAFLSTSRKKTNLHPFVPNSGKPLLLEIRCPAGTPMALMEADGGMEDEYLLGCGTRFHVTGHDTITAADTVHMLTAGLSEAGEVLRITLDVVGHPPGSAALPVFHFDPAAANDETGEAAE